MDKRQSYDGWEEDFKVYASEVRYELEKLQVPFCKREQVSYIDCFENSSSLDAEHDAKYLYDTWESDTGEPPTGHTDRYLHKTYC